MNNQQALLKAAKDGTLTDVQRLVDAGGVDLNPHARELSRHPLLEASKYGHVDIVRLLLDRGADVNQVDNDEWTALIWAAAKNLTNVVLLLLQRGAYINALEKGRGTALHCAAERGHVEAICVLLDHGADRTLKDKYGNTAEDDARQFEKQAAADVLRDYAPSARSNINVPSPTALPSIADQTDELASLRAQLQATTDQLAATRAQHVTTRRELDAAHAVLDAAHASHAHELDRSQRRISRLTRERDTARQDIVALTQRAAAHGDETATAQGELDSSRQRAMTETRRAVAAEQGLRAANATIAELRLARDQLQAELDAQHVADPIISSDELQPLEAVLGHGANGEVRAARLNGFPCAVKRLFATDATTAFGELSSSEDARVRALIRRECAVLAQLRCPYLVAFYGFVCDAAGRPETIVVELLTPVRRESAPSRAVPICRDLSLALRYLHARGIIHRDVKLSNTLYDERYDVYKLGDLGEAQTLRNRASATISVRGTPLYHAPEVQDDTARPTVALDIFAFGVTVIEVFTGLMPNPTGALRNMVLVPEVERRAADLDRLSHATTTTTTASSTASSTASGTRAMVVRCLDMSPIGRPAAAECAAHFLALAAEPR